MNLKIKTKYFILKKYLNIFNLYLFPYHMKGGDEGVVGNIEKRGENSYRLRVSAGYTDEGKSILYKKLFKLETKVRLEKN